ncbi:uncharacterized protein BXIN_1536 [Babesia sp. Xinjiang]|uniref:uncharacterized protein n=1 Tax=Babesia sp. Xinjiang TaxID=462227 RepID=UPI000A21BCD8|nr:uncharacterized protein BXIN_1536 [Babesia sp. Xinjiang]ORM42296.1 hypothetical protein BXIN_1536 [Babesia sp. Xinjiang]
MSEPHRLQSFHIKKNSVTNRFSVYVRTPEEYDGSEVTETSDAIPSDPSNLIEGIILRNILLCFHLLNHQGRRYINTREAKAHVKDEFSDNPGLLELLENVLVVVGGGDEDGNIGKNVFIQKLECVIEALAPDDSAVLSQLRNPSNRITEYFDSLGEAGSPTIGGDSSSPVPTTDHSGSPSSQFNITAVSHNKDAGSVLDLLDSECTFKPVTNTQRYRGRKDADHVDLKQEIEDMHRFKCGRSTKVAWNYKYNQMPLRAVVSTSI